MAESARKADKPKKSSGPVLDDPNQVRQERLTLFLFLEGAIAIVAGMVLLSEFLSQGEADRVTLLIAGILFGLLIIGIGTTWMLRRRAGGN